METETSLEWIMRIIAWMYLIGFIIVGLIVLLLKYA